MTVASGSSAIVIRAERAERCEEAQRRMMSADTDRFGYERSVGER